MTDNKTSESAKRATKKYRNKRYNNDDKFCEKIKEYQRNWHNSDIGQLCRKKHYDANKELIKMKRRYTYWEKKGEIDKYKIKYPDDFQKLIEMEFIK
tara:strand:- start:97 stop:387 length:291 start_codon:yes stop_codon:yes gene_type:complete